MVEIADIRDQDSLKAWLEDQPREVSIWIASRAAMRVVPIWWQAVLTQTWARERDLTALPALRCILSSAVSAKLSTRDLNTAASDALTAAKSIDFISDGNSAVALAAAVNSAASATPSVSANAAAANAASYSAEVAHTATAGAAVTIAVDATWSALKVDAEQVKGRSLTDALPLWSIDAHPLKPEWKGIQRRVARQSDAADWRFWLDWYEAQLEGRTILPDPARTWEMLEKIALIDSDTWDAGPEAVNPKIREIWELYRLRVEVAALQAEKDAFLAMRASEVQRSHNQPPDGLVDDQPELARQITIVGNSLDEARDALEQDAPDKSRLRDIADRLLSALNVIVRYCGRVADATVMAAAKVGGGAVGTALLDHVANNGRLMQFAKDLLTYGGG